MSETELKRPSTCARYYDTDAEIVVSLCSYKTFSLIISLLIVVDPIIVFVPRVLIHAICIIAFSLVVRVVLFVTATVKMKGITSIM